jgi:hypothetical protein
MVLSGGDKWLGEDSCSHSDLCDVENLSITKNPVGARLARDGGLKDAANQSLINTDLSSV